MRGLKNVTLQEVCSVIEDPGADGVTKFSLVELLFAAMITVLRDAVSYTDMAQIGSKKLTWFQKCLPYENGMPAAGTFRNVLCRLDPEKVHTGFTDRMKGALESFRNPAWLHRRKSHQKQPDQNGKTDTYCECICQCSEFGNWPGCL